MDRIDEPHQTVAASCGSVELTRTRWSRGQRLSGVVPPMVTPLADIDELDRVGLERLLEHLLRGGVHGVFILGTTGEAPSLSLDLRRRLMIETVAIVQRRVPVLVGVTDNSVVETMHLTRQAAEAGADAVVVTAPCYFPAKQAELTDYVLRIADTSVLPLFLYNMPRLTRVAFEPDTVVQLADHPNIVGIKDSSGNFNYFKSLCQQTSHLQGWSNLIGTEQLLVQAMGVGACGCVGGGANVWPQLLVGLYEALQADDRVATARLQQGLDLLTPLFNCGDYAVGPIRGLKCALDLLGICSGMLAPPLTPCVPSQVMSIGQVLENVNAQHHRLVPAPMALRHNKETPFASF